MMNRLPDLVIDSKLDTLFRDELTIHSYPEVDEDGSRFSQEEHWRRDRLLGRGGFGKVWLERCATRSSKSSSLRAVKSMHKPLQPNETLGLYRELEAIAKFSHERYKRWFVRSHGWYEDTDSIFISMEYCRHGDLQHYLKGIGAVNVTETHSIMKQVLEGLDQMHKNDFAHRDLKPGNILIKSMPPDEKWWVVLADFGISKREEDNTAAITTIKGTTKFMAPEMLGYIENLRPRTIADFQATDVWAVGEITFQILAGEPTFRNHMELMTYCLGQREFPAERLPQTISADGREFLAGAMALHPSDRMTAIQCLQHPWMEKVPVEEANAGSILRTLTPGSDEDVASARWTTERTQIRAAEERHHGSLGSRKPIRTEPTEAFPSPRAPYAPSSEAREPIGLHTFMESENNWPIQERPIRHSLKRRTHQPLELRPEPVKLPRQAIESAPKSISVRPRRSISDERHPQAIRSETNTISNFEQQKLAPKSDEKLHPELLTPPPPNSDFPKRFMSLRRSASIDRRRPGAPSASSNPNDGAILSVANVNAADPDQLSAIQQVPTPTTKLDGALTLEPRSLYQSREPRMRVRGRKRTSASQNHLHTPGNSNTTPNDLNHDEPAIRPIRLKTLFGVSIATSEPLSVIQNDLIRVFREVGFRYIEIKGGFRCQCYPILTLHGATDLFNRLVNPPRHNLPPFGLPEELLSLEVFIVQIPTLGLHGIQFKKVFGDMTDYKNVAQEILKRLDL